jgi:hypothetical protein
MRELNICIRYLRGMIQNGGITSVRDLTSVAKQLQALAKVQAEQEKK